MVVVIHRETIRNENVQVQNQTPVFLSTLNIVNTITNLALGGVVIGAFMFANLATHRGSNALSEHIYLCVFGYLILMAQAVHGINPHTGWATGFSCRNKNTIHYTLQIIGSLLALIGGLIISIDRRSYSSLTIHSIFGYITMVFTVASLIGGVFNLYSTKVTNKRLLRITHILLGCLTLLSAFITVILGFTAIRYRGRIDVINSLSLVVLTIISLLGILFSPFLSLSRALT